MDTKEKVGSPRQERREEVYRPAPQRKAPARAGAPRTATSGKRPAARPAQGGRGKNASARPTDSQYQPYKKANRKRKAKRNVKIRRFFSAQNPLLQMVKNLGSKKDAFADGSELAIKRQQERAAAEEKKKRRENYFATPAVVYTQPVPFNRDRLLVQMLTVIAVVVAFVLGLSTFFKVGTITVTGAEVYSPWTVREASGIREGDNLLTFSRARASGQITANLPYVNRVRIGIKLPDTVNIEIEEESVVYAIKSGDSTWWLMDSDGKVVEMSNNVSVKSYTQVQGVTLESPEENAQAVATEDVPTATDEAGETIPLTITGKQRLNAALQILKALEDNDIVGEAASVDVTRLEDIILWYGTRYQVNLGDMENMEYKIACMNDAVLQMKDYQTGILDISFTTWPDKVGYTPFE